MLKAQILKEKRLWWRLLLPVGMAATAVMVEAHLLKSPEVEAAALEATAMSRRQSPVVAAQALAATAVSRRQSPVVAAQALAATAVSRRQSLASD